MTISQEEAERKAAYELRFEIGNMPHLSDPEYDEELGAYVYEIRYTHPEIPTEEEIKDPEIDQEVEFYESQQIGEMKVFDDGRIERTSNEELQENIREVRELAESGEIDSC